MTCIALWRRHLIACAAFMEIILPMAAQADQKTLVELSQAHTITTRGHIETKVRPDRVHVTFAVSTTEKSLADAYKLNSDNASSLIAVADQLKIAKADIQTGQIEVQPEYAEDQRTHRLNRFVPMGFTVTRDVSFVLKNVDNLASLLSAGLQHGANGIQSVHYECSDAPKIRSTARVAALKAARDKANELAEAAGEKVGKPLIISEGFVQEQAYAPSLSGATNGTIGPRGVSSYVHNGSDGIELGTISIDADVTVTFELE